MRAGNRPQAGYRGKWCLIVLGRCSSQGQLLYCQQPRLSRGSLFTCLLRKPTLLVLSSPGYSSLRSFLLASKNALVFVIFLKNPSPVPFIYHHFFSISLKSSLCCFHSQGSLAFIPYHSRSSVICKSLNSMAFFQASHLTFQQHLTLMATPLHSFLLG